MGGATSCLRFASIDGPLSITDEEPPRRPSPRAIRSWHLATGRLCCHWQPPSDVGSPADLASKPGPT